MYESPIEKIYSDIQSQIIKQDEEHMMCAVNQATNYIVDKEELIKALQYDREQYDKGYKDGKIKIFEKVKQAREEIENKYDDLANAWCEREEGRNEAILEVLDILDKLIEESEG